MSKNQIGRSTTKKTAASNTLAFDKGNYTFLIIGLLLIVVGFMAMYLEDKVYGVISLYISPEIIIAGYIVVIYAILKPAADSGKQAGESP